MRRNVVIFAVIMLVIFVITIVPALVCSAIPAPPPEPGMEPKTSVHFSSERPRELIVFGEINRTMQAEVNAQIGEVDRIDNIQIYSGGGFTDWVAPVAESLLKFGRPIHIDNWCLSACVALALDTRAVISNDAYLGFHEGSNEPFKHAPGCKFCRWVEPYFQRAFAWKNDNHVMSKWADILSPGLGRFLESCGVYDNPNQGRALTWLQIKSFGTTGGISKCSEIEGQTIPEMDKIVRSRQGFL